MSENTRVYEALTTTVLCRMRHRQVSTGENSEFIIANIKQWKFGQNDLMRSLFKTKRFTLNSKEYLTFEYKIQFRTFYYFYKSRTIKDKRRVYVFGLKSSLFNYFLQ